MLTRQLHFFPIIDSKEVRVAYQITMTMFICFNCQLVWYQEDIANEIQCSNCPKMARGFVVSSGILGSDIEWEDFCKMIEVLKTIVDVSISGMLSEGIYFSHKMLQILFTSVENDKKEIIPVWRIFLGADGFTKSVIEMKMWVGEGVYLIDHINKHGWPEETHYSHSTKQSKQEIKEEELNEFDIVQDAMNFLKQEK